MKREFLIPLSLETIINENLNQFGLTLSNYKKIASCIQWQSDYYILNPNQPTPWQDERAQIAQWAYYLPLNFLRNLAVFTQLKKHIPLVEFEGALDYGAGLGASSWALREMGFQGSLSLYDRISVNPNIARALAAEEISKVDFHRFQNHLSIFSYSLTELVSHNRFRNELLNHLPYLVMLEPSTQKEGRRLSETRRYLIENDYQIIAPCTHQKNCPLLIQSEKDWCHDRILFKKPEWMARYEKELPFRNDSLTFSYLIAFKKPAIKAKWHRPPLDSITARITGDWLRENGKDKQMVCFDDRRLFLVWMHKYKLEQILPRGGCVEIPVDFELVSNEIRVKKEIKYLV